MYVILSLESPISILSPGGVINSNSAAAKSLVFSAVIFTYLALYEHNWLPPVTPSASK